MEEVERIRGKNRFKILEQFRQDKTVIRMHLLGKPYERLTVVTGIRRQNGRHYLLLDYPWGFKSAVADMDVWKIHLECTGKDKLHYTFRTFGGDFSSHEIWVQFPKIIRRAQRRKDFRLEAPSGTKILFRYHGERHDMNVRDISLGGALVSLEKRIRKMLLNEVGKTLRQLCVVFPSRDEEPLIVSVQEALIKRWEKDPLTGQYRYALQFVQIDKEQKETLRQLIYKFQRGLLRKRQRLED